MRIVGRIHVFLIVTCKLLTLENSAAQENGGFLKKLQFDIIGDIHYSKYNFTDIKSPYNGLDGWSEAKFAYWVDANKSFSPYLSIIPVSTTEREFWWQRNIQAGFGIQWYPFDYADAQFSQYFRSIRIFAMLAYRYFYDNPSGGDEENVDFQIGSDFYYDNLFDRKSFTNSSWTNLTYRKSNFSFDDYKAILWTGNVKLGFKFKSEKSILFPYIVIDWTYVGEYSARWWENFLRLGIGVQFYPRTEQLGMISKNFMQRVHIYATTLHNSVWLGDSPSGDVKEFDIRIGFGFSTGGYFRN